MHTIYRGFSIPESTLVGHSGKLNDDTVTGDYEDEFYIQRDYCVDAEAQTSPCVTSVQNSDEITYYGGLQIHIDTEATTNVIVLRRAKKIDRKSVV